MHEPNLYEIKAYLTLLFNGTEPKDYPGGLIQISNLYNCEFFPITQLEKAADYIYDLNSKGQNVYTCSAICKPDAKEVLEERKKQEGKQNLRAKTESFYYTNTCRVDIDDVVNDDEFRKKYAHAKPAAYVITSKKEKTVSVHFWWDLDNPCGDLELLKDVNKGIIEALGGDKGTQNPMHLMKIGGTVAHPKKEGRVTQMTVYKNTGAFPPNDILKLKEAYPLKDKKTERLSINNNILQIRHQKEGFSLDDILSMLATIHPDNEYFDWLKVGMALHSADAPFEFWDNWSAKGDNYPGTQALLNKWNGFTKSGGITIGTLYHHAHQNGFRFKKESTVSGHQVVDRLEQPGAVDPETGEVTPQQPPEPIKAQDIGDIDLDNIPPRAWLFGTMAARKYVTMIGASPGAGKSIFTMQAAICATAGMPLGTHAPQEDSIKTWIFNNEEGEEELRRRLKGILLHNNIDPKDLKGRFYMNSGEDRSICVAKRHEDGAVIHTPDYDALKAEVISKEIDFLVVDPFAETHDLSENSNDEIKRVAGMYRSIAIECNCAVLLVHHTRKGGSNSDQSSEQNSNMDNLRGGGAQLGVVRRVFTLAKMDEKAAKKLDVSPEARRWYVRLDDAKSNITAPADSTEWYKFKSIPINNGNAIYADGDHVGVLLHKTAEEIEGEETTRTSEERTLLLTRLARVFIKNSIDSASVSKCAEMLLEDGYGKYKDRHLRKIIPDYVQKMSKNNPIISEGYRCFFDILEGTSDRVGNKICLHMKEISDF